MVLTVDTCVVSRPLSSARWCLRSSFPLRVSFAGSGMSDRSSYVVDRSGFPEASGLLANARQTYTAAAVGLTKRVNSNPSARIFEPRCDPPGEARCERGRHI